MMQRKFYNKKDFDVILTESQKKELKAKRYSFSNRGEQATYDVFLSHSTKDMVLIKKIRDVLESKYDISVYVDWDEDAGTPRYQIADKVKDAMGCSKTFLVVKTDNSDDSSWVSWETGYFDKEGSDKIGVLLVEDDDSGFNNETFKHQEYLRNYVILGPEDIVDFISEGSYFIKRKINNNNNVKFDVEPKPYDISRRN